MKVPVTGSVLAWAIKEGGYTLPQFARRLGVETGMLEAWVTEADQPGKTKFVRIAEILKRPTAMFLLPGEPRTSVSPNLRKARGRDERLLTPDERISVRWVSRLQRTTRELLDGEGALALPSVDTIEPEAAAAIARESLGVSIDAQMSWQDERVAFWSWKEAIEKTGIFVVQLPLGEDGVRGFSVWDEVAPFIAINQSADPSYHVRTFSMLHEFGHLLCRDEAACERFSWEARRNEHWCDSFAGAVLIPKDQLEASLNARGLAAPEAVDTVNEASPLARAFTVSLRATTIRLIDLGYAPQRLYGAVERVAKPKGTTSNRPGGPTTVERRKQELGPRLLRLFLRSEREGRLAPLATAECLRMPYTQLTDLAAAIGEPA